MDAPIFAPIIRTAPPSPSLDVPRVMRRARGLVRAHPFSLLAATLVFNAAPEVAVNAIHLDPSLRWMATLGVFSLTTIGSSVLGSFFVGWAALTLADDQGGRRNVSSFEVWKRLVVMGPSLILTAYAPPAISHRLPRGRNPSSTSSVTIPRLRASMRFS